MKVQDRQNVNPGLPEKTGWLRAWILLTLRFVMMLQIRKWMLKKNLTMSWWITTKHNPFLSKLNSIMYALSPPFVTFGSTSLTTESLQLVSRYQSQQDLHTLFSQSQLEREKVYIGKMVFSFLQSWRSCLTASTFITNTTLIIVTCWPCRIPN